MNSEQQKLLPDYRLILLFAGTFLLIYLLLPILSPFLMASILAYIANPFVDKLSKLRIASFTLGRTLATSIVIVLLFSLILIGFLIIIPLFNKEISLIIQRIPIYLANLHDKLEPLLIKHFGVSLEIDSAQIQNIVTTNWKSAGNFAGKFLLQISSHGLALVMWLANLIIVPVVLFYVLRDWHIGIAKIAMLIPRKWLGITTTITSEIDHVLAEFLRGQLSVMVLMSFFYSIALWFTGLELALPIGLIAGMLGFVPYLGISTGILLALLSALLQFSSIGDVIPVLAVFGIGQLLEGMLLTPKLVGDRIGLHPVVVIFALLAGGQLFGFSGVLLALPMSAAIAVGVKHAKKSYLQSKTYLE